jgi:hypothetical protein
MPIVIRHSGKRDGASVGSTVRASRRAHGILHRIGLPPGAATVALNPLISLFGLSLGALLSSSLPVELIVGSAGNRTAVPGSDHGDFALVLGMVMFSTRFFGRGQPDCGSISADPRIDLARDRAESA